MASLIYDSMMEDMANGNINFSSHTFYNLLVTSTYSPNKKTHTRRSDVTNEVSGTGYVANGQASAPTVTLDTANDRCDITFADNSWASSTITARACVYYRFRGGASSADELVFYGDFGSDTTTTGGTFSLDYTGPLRMQN